jgi:hypothetical protein
VQLVLLVLRELQVPLEPQAQPGLRVQPVFKGFKGHKVFKVFKASKALKVFKEILAQREPLDRQVTREQQATLGLPVPPELRVLQVLLGLPAPLD